MVSLLKMSFAGSIGFVVRLKLYYWLSKYGICMYLLNAILLIASFTVSSCWRKSAEIVLVVWDIIFGASTELSSIEDMLFCYNRAGYKLIKLSENDLASME
jgi:hypothetical protein